MLFRLPRPLGRGSRIIISIFGFSQTSIWAKAQFHYTIFIHALKGVANQIEKFYLQIKT